MENTVKKIGVVVILMLSLFLAACGPAAPAPAGTPEVTPPAPATPTPQATATPEPSAPGGMKIGKIGEGSVKKTYNGQEIERVYYYYIPTAYSPDVKMPLMLVLHGSGSNALWQLGETNFVEIAEREGFIVLAPNSVAIHADGQTLSSTGSMASQLGVDASNVRWNACPATDPQNKFGVDDAAYLGELIDYFVATLNVDAGRVYSTGLSHGAFMSIRLALTIPEKLAGIAPVAGLLATEYAGVVPADKMKIVFINGDADPVVPSGGMTYATGDFAYSLDETVGLFLDYYNLPKDAPGVTELPKTVADDPTRIIRYEYAANENAAIVKYVVEGGGHTWPGGTQYAAAEWIGLLSSQASASELIWSELKDVHK